MTTETVKVVLWQDDEPSWAVEIAEFDACDEEKDATLVDRAILDRYVWWQAEGEALQTLLRPLYEDSFEGIA